MFDDGKEIIAHEIDFLAMFSESFYFFEAASRVVDLSVLAEDSCLSHHFLDVFIDGEDAV